MAANPRFAGVLPFAGISAPRCRLEGITHVAHLRLHRQASFHFASGLNTGRGTVLHAVAHFFTVSQVRVVTLAPNVFSIRVMNTGPRGFGT